MVRGTALAILQLAGRQPRTVVSLYISVSSTFATRLNLKASFKAALGRQHSRPPGRHGISCWAATIADCKWPCTSATLVAHAYLTSTDCEVLELSYSTTRHHDGIFASTASLHLLSTLYSLWCHAYLHSTVPAVLCGAEAEAEDHTDHTCIPPRPAMTLHSTFCEGRTTISVGTARSDRRKGSMAASAISSGRIIFSWGTPALHHSQEPCLLTCD